MTHAATTTRTLREMTLEVYETNKANGWFDDDRAFYDDIALTHSEISEMFEAYRDNGYDDSTATYVGHAAEFPEGAPPIKPEGFGSEAADVLVRTLDSAHRWYVEFPWATLEDVPGYRIRDEFTIGAHISMLHLLATQVEEADPSRGLGSLIVYLVAWCKHLGIDLQAEFDRKVAFNKTRGYKHGGKRI